jgi:transposase-like protein
VEQLNNPRELRGLAILSQGNAITKVGTNTYLVKSQAGAGDYSVKKNGKMWTCTCPNFAEYQMDCKHIYAVKFSLKLRQDVEAEIEPKTHDKPDYVPELCPSCESGNIIKRGIRKTKYGDAQRYGCLACGHRFTMDKGFSRMKHDPKAITLAMDLYFKGVSYRKITDHLGQFYGLKVNQTTPMRWVKKYLKLLGQYSEKYKAEVGNIWPIAVPEIIMPAIIAAANSPNMVFKRFPCVLLILFSILSPPCALRRSAPQRCGSPARRRSAAAARPGATLLVMGTAS